MKIDRKFTEAGKDAYADVEFVTTVSEIRNPDGTIVFKLDDVEVPKKWSQVASDVIAQKYFRKAGVPTSLKKVKEKDVPEFLWRSVPATDTTEKTGEISAKQVFDRLAGAWAYWGWKGGYFSTEDDARAYYDEMRHMLATQRAAPNSPQWFNTGLHWAYGIDGPGQGHFYVDYQSGELTKSTSAYEHPQPHACFIQSVKDDLVGDGGIMDLWVREARLFKYGSGTGTNFSHLRASNEALSGGGKSSGLMGFLKIGDRAAGAIKSGGTTRRAAKMVIVDADHPDVEEYINWKVKKSKRLRRSSRAPNFTKKSSTRFSAPFVLGMDRAKILLTQRRMNSLKRPSVERKKSIFQRHTSSACSTTQNRGLAALSSQPMTRIGTRKPTRRYQVKTQTTRSASQMHISRL